VDFREAGFKDPHEALAFITQEVYWAARGLTTDPRLADWCGRCSQAICIIAESIGIDCKFVKGCYLEPEELHEELGVDESDHCWVELDGRVYDATIMQFNVEDKPLLGEAPVPSYLETRAAFAADLVFRGVCWDVSTISATVAKLLTIRKNTASLPLST
jgi:hypothetical protein